MSLATYAETAVKLLAEQIAHRPFPELAAAIRGELRPILDDFRVLVQEAVPRHDQFTIIELENAIAAILTSVADALETANLDELRTLLEHAPEHGLDRFRLGYDLLDLLQEQRILRGVIIARVEKHLGRQCTAPEAASLHALINVMDQQGVLTLVHNQEERLRRSSESELQYLSFLSHDLNNHLMVVTSRLEAIKHELGAGDNAQRLEESLTAIRQTRAGRKRLLDHVRMRKSGVTPMVSRVNLRTEVLRHVTPLIDEAKRREITFELDVPADAVVATDADLLALILQNVIGNAAKHASPGVVWISAAREGEGRNERWDLTVADQGPGIAPEHVDQLFEAFHRGESLGTPGVGLGLCIASQAARLIHAELGLETKPGAGSTFHCHIPVNAHQPAEND